MAYADQYRRALLVFENVYCNELMRIMNQVDRLKQNDYTIVALTPYVDQETVACKIVIQRINFIFAAADYILAHDILLDEYKPQYDYKQDYDFFNFTCLYTLEKIFKCAMLLFPVDSEMRKRVLAYVVRLDLVANELPRAYKDNQFYLRRYNKLRNR